MGKINFDISRIACRKVFEMIGSENKKPVGFLSGVSAIELAQELDGGGFALFSEGGYVWLELTNTFIMGKLSSLIGQILVGVGDPKENIDKLSRIYIGNDTYRFIFIALRYLVKYRGVEKPTKKDVLDYLKQEPWMTELDFVGFDNTLNRAIDEAYMCELHKKGVAAYELVQTK